MAIEAKTTLLSEMERGLSSKLTATDLAAVMSELADKLDGYHLECVSADENVRDDLLDAYLSALSVEGRSPKTVDRYKYILGRMYRSLNVLTRNISVYHLRRYLADEKARGVSERTLEGYRQIFSAYFNWLHREGLISTNPAANLGAIKYPKKQKDIFTDVDIERMKFACYSMRDRAIVCFLKATGCRVGELVRLNREDVDMENCECKVLGKGNKERIVFFDQICAMTLSAYLKTRKDSSPALFAGRGTQRMTENGIRVMLKKLEETANVSHIHPHKFRRTTATNLIRHGMPIQEVSAILGHDKLDTTMGYVVLDKTDMKNSYRKYA